uniref:V-type proton ATPase subunit n=1 Tax=Romanomermis culicivorax TaxID=13658 RepID=A0A915HT17_ROMCU
MESGSIAIPLIVVTLFWAVVGGGIPWIVPKGPNRGIIQTMLVLTACCCWLFWFMAFLHQLNPLLGPQLSNSTILFLKHKWGTYNNK